MLRYPRPGLLADERGSVIAMTDGTGTVTQINKYDPYGVPDSENAGRFQFTGQMWIPEVKLYHFKARAYHPGLGRFLQPDPSGFAGGPNLYAYASDDPVNEIDSTGLCSQMQDSNGNPLTPWSCRNDNCGFLDCTPEPPPNALANLFYSLGPPEFTQQIPCLAGVGCYVPPGGTVPPEAASPQENPGQEDQLQCAKGKLARLASGLIQDGTAVTFAGTVVTAGGGALTASGALASALGQPELLRIA